MKDMCGVEICVGDIVVNTASNKRAYDYGRVIGFTEKRVIVDVIKDDFNNMRENKISYAQPARLAIHVSSKRECVSTFTFTLTPNIKDLDDPRGKASRSAMFCYAENIERDDPSLAKKLRRWATEFAGYHYHD